jgi:hypothetical protein
LRPPLVGFKWGAVLCNTSCHVRFRHSHRGPVMLAAAITAAVAGVSAHDDSVSAGRQPRYQAAPVVKRSVLDI